jgi:pSer/pThr/pTyr-binding forkhead associated (FHA) protein
MAKLILSIEGATLKEIPLTKGRTTIGRKPQNDIQIDNLAISGEHAVLALVGNDVFLEDMNSTNGTFVNGQQVKKHLLQNGDSIELGKYSLKYVSEAAQHAPGADFEKTMILRPGAMPHVSPTTTPAASASAHEATSAGMMAQTAARATAPTPAAATPLGVIQILSGGNAGKQLELVKTLTTLGKPGVQVAVIARRPHGYFITHVEGASFPVVNGQMIGTQAHQLNDHAIIELAGIKMEFFLKS